MLAYMEFWLVWHLCRVQWLIMKLAIVKVGVVVGAAGMALAGIEFGLPYPPEIANF